MRQFATFAAFLLCVLIVRAQSDADWVPPIGIPTPAFGVTNGDVEDYASVNPTVSGTTTNGSATITFASAGDLDDLTPGMTISGTGVPAGAKVLTLASSTSITITANATASGTVSLSFDYPEANSKPYTYYVDRTHGSATNTNNPFGSPSTPRLTWPYPVERGAAVQIHGSGYATNNGPSSTFVLGGVGTASKPIFFYSVETDPASYPTITTGASTYLWGNYMIVERLKWANDSTANTRPLLRGSSVSHVTVRHCVTQGLGNNNNNATAFSTGGSSGNDATHTTDNLVIWDCSINSIGNWLSADQYDSCAVIFSQNATNCFFLDSTVYHMQGDGARFGADQGDTASGGFYYMGRVTVYENKENAVDIKQADNAVISECVFHTFRDTASSGSVAVTIHYNGSNVWFINNTVYDCYRAFMSTGIDNENLWLIGNLVYDCSEYGMYLDRGGGNFKVYNNTIVDCAEGIVSTGTIDSMDLRNNVIIDATSGRYLALENTTAAAASTASNELYFESASGAVSIRWGASTYTSVAAWISGTTVGDNSIEQDPLFVNAVGNDFTLQVSSPAINAGYSWTSAATTAFNAAFAHDLNTWTDLSGTEVDGTPDIGFDQYAASGGGGGGAPEAPSSLTLTAVRNVGWTADWPAVTGATSYDVQYRVGSGDWTSVTTTETDVTLSSLSAGTAYEVQVRATNGAGSSSYTAASPTTISTAAPAPVSRGRPGAVGNGGGL